MLTQHLGAGRLIGIGVNCIASDAILTDRNLEQIPPHVQENLRTSIRSVILERLTYDCVFTVEPANKAKAMLASRFKFTTQKSKLAGAVRGSHFVIKGEY